MEEHSFIFWGDWRSGDVTECENALRVFTSLRKAWARDGVVGKELFRQRLWEDVWGAKEDHVLWTWRVERSSELSWEDYKRFFHVSTLRDVVERSPNMLWTTLQIHQ